MNPALLITLQACKSDPALRERGDRKLLVTELYADREEEATDVAWQPRTASGKCPVRQMPDTEFAVFTQAAKQTRHYHRLGTEIYTVIEGRMTIEVEGIDYSLAPGDVLVVKPRAVHEVKRKGAFLCHVLTVNCGGAKDRFNAKCKE
jgi:quercetin dioxygenase-like cupin family protein